jgi:cytochrome c
MVTARAGALPLASAAAAQAAHAFCRCSVVAIASLWIAGCTGDPAGSAATQAAPSAAGSNGGRATTNAGAPPQAAPRAAGFDVGAIKSAAEYLAEPEFAGADLRRGELLAFACSACHTLGAGEPHNIGPNLHGVFGRRAAALPDFAYSPALRASGLVWTPRALAAWLEDPARFVEGTTMVFAGYRQPEERRDLIAYLLNKTR